MFHVEHTALRQPPVDVPAALRGEVGPGTWITLIEDDRARFQIELNLGMAFLHLSLYRWGPSILRACRAGIEDAKTLLREAGYEFVHVTILDGDPLLYKFERLMGFEEWRRAGIYIVMRQSTESGHG